MSILGDFARLDPETLAWLRRHPIKAYHQLTALPDASRLDLGPMWARLSALMDAGRFPINPIAAGSPYPDEHTAWGAEGDSRCLMAEEVAQSALYLSQTPFDILKPHLRQVLEAKAATLVNLDPDSPRYLEPLSPEEAEQVHMSDERVRDIQLVLANRYEALVAFFDVAAESGQCTVFWAA
ncbi:YfbM family protein [Micromonospora lupini]|uniref:DUF1877 family protein n=1 Tax=Micromonospora lupini TaxID=285679 RepID=UPI002256C3CA|nr:DUF1877 family protein [Micromonospora lupini]MCX5069982.1 YfbM family protein [Micromonospora lupini]